MLALMLGSCSPFKTAALRMPTPPEETLSLETEQEKLIRLRQAVLVLRAQVKAQEQVVADVDWAWAHRLAKVLAAGAILGVVIATGFALYFRSKALASIAIACVGMLAGAIFTDFVLYHRVIALTGLVVVGLITFGVVWWHAHRDKKHNWTLASLLDEVTAQNHQLQNAITRPMPAILDKA